MSRKEQVVQMTDMDELRANIPMSSARVGGENQRGRAIDPPYSCQHSGERCEID